MITYSLKSFISFALASFLFGATTTSKADLIDFTDASVWGAVSGSTATVGNTTLTAAGTNLLNTATPSALTFNAGACGANPSLSLACQGRG